MILRAIPPAYSPAPIPLLLQSLTGTDSLRDFLLARFSAREGLLTDSGTSALRLAIEIAACARPGPCLLPGYACFDLATAVVGANVRACLYDVDPITLAPDLESLGRVAKQGASSIVMVSLFGIPCDPDPIRSIARDAGAVLIEDAAQGAGGRWHGVPLGALGDLSVLSFGRGKGRAGGGGALLLRHPDLSAEEVVAKGFASSKRAFLRLLAESMLSTPQLYGVPARLPFLGLGRTIYREPKQPKQMASFSRRMIERAWSIGEEEAAHRRKWVRRYGVLLPDRVRFSATLDPRAEPSWLRYPFLANDLMLRRIPNVRLGIARSYPATLGALRAMSTVLPERPVLPGAEHLAKSLVTLPTHSRVSDREQQLIVEWVIRHSSGADG